MSKFQINFKGNKKNLHDWLKRIKKEEGENINTIIINLIAKEKIKRDNKK